MKFLGGIEASGGIDNNINIDMVLDQRWALCAQRQEPHTRPSIGRTVLQPPTLKKRARDVAQLHAQLSAVKRRLRSPSRAPIRLRSKGPPLFGEGGRRQAEARKRSRSGQRWWFAEQQKLHATTVATVAIDTGTELKVLDGLDARAGVVVEIAHATDHEEGPKLATEAEERVFVISKKGEYYLETVPVGNVPPDIATVLRQVEQEVQDAVNEAVTSVSTATSNALEELKRLLTAVSAEEAAAAGAAARVGSATAAAAPLRRPAVQRGGNR